MTLEEEIEVLKKENEDLRRLVMSLLEDLKNVTRMLGGKL